MPKFNIEEKESVQVAKATFDKESDYKAVILTADKTKKVRLLHKIQADKLIESKRATESKEISLVERDVEHLTETPVKKSK